MGSAPSNSDVRAGSDASAEKVTAPTNRSESWVSAGATCAPASTSRRQTSTALYAAIPPVTQRTPRRPRSATSMSSLVSAGGRSRSVGRRLLGGRLVAFTHADDLDLDVDLDLFDDRHGLDLARLDLLERDRQ